MPSRHRAQPLLTTLLLCGSIACGGASASPSEPAAAGTAEPAAAAPAAGQHQDIRHLEPRPDSVGAQPARFTWSKVESAESYTLRIWNEADVRVVSETGLTDTTIDFPKEYDMPSGTYFWAVVGMRGPNPVAESGLAAFVVQK